MFRYTLTDKRIKFNCLTWILFFIHICENIFAVFLTFILFQCIFIVGIQNHDDVIDRGMDVRLAPALKAGGQGVRYTCRVGQSLVYLFHDRDFWFVEDG